MRQLMRFCTIALFALFPALATDRVVLTNGDTISGAIVKKEVFRWNSG